MNILVDIQDDGDLAYAMHFLFEKRLGHILYWIKGDEWVDNNYYGKGLGFLIERNTGYKEKWDWHYKTITFQEFLSCKDTFGATLGLCMQTDWGPFDRLIKDHIPQAKHIRHIGNPAENLKDSRFEHEISCARNVIFSIVPEDATCRNFSQSIINEGRNYIFAHQEFDLNEFKFMPAVNYNRITGFHPHLCRAASYLSLWQPLQSLLLDFEWKFHGRSSKDGFLKSGPQLAKAFINTSFVLQLKADESCGGHLTHNAFATGRPLICKKSFYRGMMLDMLVDGVTCIDLDQRSSPQENAEFIRYCSEPTRWQQMSQNAFNTFKQYCDYIKEAKDVEQFIKGFQ